MSDRPNPGRGEKTLGELGIAISSAERREQRDARRDRRSQRIARNRAEKKSKGKRP